uniref:XK-related protein n=1 Tax=Oryza barthii TaxID=65489 RepID=A0A0D3F9K4_9ORYZ
MLQGLMLLLWLYLFDCMRTYVTDYVGDGDSWFTKFVLFVVAVPMADLFSIFAWLCLRLPLPGCSPLERPRDF